MEMITRMQGVTFARADVEQSKASQALYGRRTEPPQLTDWTTGLAPEWTMGTRHPHVGDRPTCTHAQLYSGLVLPSPLLKINKWNNRPPPTSVASFVTRVAAVGAGRAAQMRSKAAHREQIAKRGVAELCPDSR